MNTFSFPQISVNYKDADAAKRIFYYKLLLYRIFYFF